MNITRGKQQHAQKVVIYGVPGIGKSTLASQFPNPLFIDTEGSTSNLDVARFDTPTSYEMIKAQIDYVKANPTICKTLVIDTIDWADSMLVEALCMQHNKKGIEEFGYGQGYTYAKEELGRFLNKLTEIVNLGINVVLLAHSQVVKFELPEEQGSYDRYQLKLTGKTAKRNAELILEWADMVLFCNFETVVQAVDSKGSKFKAQGNARVMYTSHNAVWEAKNRHALPFKLPLEYNSIKHIFEANNIQQNITPIPTFATTPAVEIPQQITPTIANNATVDNTFKPDYVPQALWDLMQKDGITLDNVEDAVAKKGFFPKGTTMENYPQEFINGALIAGWSMLKAFIEKEIKHQTF